MTEILMTIVIISILIPVTMLSVSIMTRTMNTSQQIQDLIGIQQLRRILLTADHITSDGNCIRFDTEEGQRRIRQVNRNLIIQPGTLIMLTDLDSSGFYEENGIYYLYYYREGKEHHASLCHE